MGLEMRRFVATDQHGKTVHVSAYTESEARQMAEELLGHGNIISFEEE